MLYAAFLSSPPAWSPLPDVPACWLVQPVVVACMVVACRLINIQLMPAVVTSTFPFV
jgi:hypothetical protein